MDTIYDTDEDFATVGAREDIDGTVKTVFVCSDRRGDVESATLEMTPKTARALARRLNRWARLVDSK